MKVDLKKWHKRNQWYEAIDEVHEKRSRLENMIAWAQVEIYEKEADKTKAMIEEQEKNIEKVNQGVSFTC